MTPREVQGRQRTDGGGLFQRTMNHEQQMKYKAEPPLNNSPEKTGTISEKNKYIELRMKRTIIVFLTNQKD